MCSTDETDKSCAFETFVRFVPSLKRSGEHFVERDIVEIARLGHFYRDDWPWEVLNQW